MPLHFSSKDFEILDLDPTNNPTSHYDACHFGYNLALSQCSVLTNFGRKWIAKEMVGHALNEYVVILINQDAFNYPLHLYRKTT